MTGIAVFVRGKDLDRAIAVFKRKLKDSGLSKELKDRSFARSPSEDKRLKRARAKARLRRQQARERRFK